MGNDCREEREKSASRNAHRTCGWKEAHRREESLSEGELSGALVSTAAFQRFRLRSESSVLWVKMRKPRDEHMLASLHPNVLQKPALLAATRYIRAA
jgi:hypothetical protein